MRRCDHPIFKRSSVHLICVIISSKNRLVFVLCLIESSLDDGQSYGPSGFLLQGSQQRSDWSSWTPKNLSKSVYLVAWFGSDLIFYSIYSIVLSKITVSSDSLALGSEISDIRAA